MPRDLHSLYNRDPAQGGSLGLAVTAGVASTEVVRQRLSRRKIVLSNDGATTIYMSRGVPAAVGAGIRLPPNSAYEDVPDALGYLWVGAWYAISTVACALAVCEDW